MRAKRSLGQNFLVDPGLACALLDAAGIGRGSRVLEIGPGRGALTREILRRGADCVAVEKDDGLVRLLGALPGGLRLIHGDALEVDLTAPDLRGRVAVGNLPYNVALPILRRLLGVSPPFPRMALMFQREVAARLVAAPGSRDHGVPSLLVALSSRAHRVLEVPPDAFQPRPRVHSSVVLLEPRPDPPLPPGAREPFLSVASTWFRYRRKTIRNALIESGLTASGAGEALSSAAVPPSARLEALSLEQLISLWRARTEVARGNACGDEDRPRSEGDGEG